MRLSFLSTVDTHQRDFTAFLPRIANSTLTSFLPRACFEQAFDFWKPRPLFIVYQRIGTPEVVNKVSVELFLWVGVRIVSHLFERIRYQLICETSNILCSDRPEKTHWDRPRHVFTS